MSADDLFVHGRTRWDATQANPSRGAPAHCYGNCQPQMRLSQRQRQKFAKSHQANTYKPNAQLLEETLESRETNSAHYKPSTVVAAE